MLHDEQFVAFFTESKEPLRNRIKHNSLFHLDYLDQQQLKK